MSQDKQSALTRYLPAISVTLAFVAMIIANALANILPLNGIGTGALSDEIPNLFVPAGLTFAIWGLIYLLLAVYVVATFMASFDRAGARCWTGLDALLFIANALANIAWIYAWHWRLLPLSLLFMLIILGTLIALSERAYARPGVSGGALSVFVDLALKTPINVYLGWICVATIANVTALLVKSDWNGFGLDPRFWTVLVIIAGLAIALGFVFRRKAYAAPLVVVWAYLGIVIKRTGVDADYSKAVWLSAAIAAALIVIALAVRTLFLDRKVKKAG